MEAVVDRFGKSAAGSQFGVDFFEPAVIQRAQQPEQLARSPADVAARVETENIWAGQPSRLREEKPGFRWAAFGGETGGNFFVQNQRCARTVMACQQTRGGQGRAGSRALAGREQFLPEDSFDLLAGNGAWPQ